MIQFILNDKEISTDQPPGSTLLDFIRYHKHLKGTKIGCREGDCGACTVLFGELKDGRVNYKSATSCITPLINAQGKHIVSIEGINQKDALTPYQEAMVKTSGSQCGMCTVGFIMSMAGESLADASPSMRRSISAIDGNICRCTGYKSIERAADLLTTELKDKPQENKLSWLIEQQFVPTYFESIPSRLQNLQPQRELVDHGIIGGGTDLLVQQPDNIHKQDVFSIIQDQSLVGIEQDEDIISIGAATITTELMESPIMNAVFPNLWQHMKLVSSTPIRNIATIAGNIVNASPIADLTAFFLGLNATVELKSKSGTSRELALKGLFLSYKKLDKADDEIIAKIKFKAPDKLTKFNFEKVSKRRYLDIASVNSAISIRVENGEIHDVHVSAGGVGPTPLYLRETRAYLIGKTLSIELIKQSVDVINEEISPISDVRGSKEYKRLLLRQLYFAHFIELFPNQFNLREFQ